MDCPEDNKFRDNAALRWIVGRIHVSTPNEQVLEKVKRTIKKRAWKKMSPEDQKAVECEVLRMHEENQKLYIGVMRGGF